MPPKSIFRQPGAKHFQLVHRSQRDPLIHDPDASKHVLKPFERENVKKGKSRADLESLLAPSDLDHDQRVRVGEAALYGVYYDDTEYDYMQHLRHVGEQQEGVESILIEAPSTSRKQNTKKTPISLRDLPPESLPSTSELPRDYESQQAIPSSITGFQPDMDPHLRQVLEALDDEAFVDDDLEDDFFGKLVADGERGSDEPVEFEFREDRNLGGQLVQDEDEGEREGDEVGGWEVRFAQFKEEHKTSAPGSDLGFSSEGEDTISRLPEISVIGGKRRRKGTSEASGYSMSSSSMFRNDALQTLDERFDHILQNEYASDDDEDEDKEEPPSDDSDDTPELITSREDFESMMDDFLDNYEILGRKMKPKLAGDNGVEKLSTLRIAMGQDDRVRIGTDDDDDDDDDDVIIPIDDDKQDRWDCETVLTTYSNIENHPRLIRARDTTLIPKIRVDPRTGMPSVVEQNLSKSRKEVESIPENDDDDDDDLPTRVTITRRRDESQEEKRARKQAVKADRQARRIDKRATKEQFSKELKSQLKGITNKEKTKMRKL